MGMVDVDHPRHRTHHIMLVDFMPKKIETSKVEEKAAVQPQVRPMTLLEQMLKLGYTTYTTATRFEQTVLDYDTRPYQVSKKISLISLKDDEGKAIFVGLCFSGIMDEKQSLIVMTKEDLKASIESAKPNDGEYTGLEFTGVNKKFGPIALDAILSEAYGNFIEIAGQLK